LKENRTVSNTLLDDLNNKTKESIDYVESKIKEEESKHPKFLDEDPVLLELLVLFEGAVGDDFEDKKKEDIKKEAEQRVANKIPPGYQDDNKEGEGAYGDYYLWRQVLEQAKKENKPIIFVTSERKDDWWERISGKTTGSRQELMKESMEFSGQRVLIYHTERFMKFAQARSEQPINEAAIEEIRAISFLRMEAVKLLKQDVEESSSYKNKGILTATLQRPVRNFTVSGHLNPNMLSSPSLNIRLLEYPNTLPEYIINAGTGTTHDFNIHIRSKNKDIPLPVGEYIIEYEALSSVGDSVSN